jgi:hypothetical protein
MSRMTYSGKDRPHLVSVAVNAIEHLTKNEVPVHPSEAALLLILCDKVAASHGQWYGSLAKLAESLPWERHWYSKWLKRLEAKGLVENLGTLPGRKLDTWQLLPWLYPVLVEAQSAISGESAATTDGGSDRYQPLVEASVPSLVEASVPSLVEHVATTNTSNTLHASEEHPLTVRPAAAQRTNSEEDVEALEAERLRQLAALRSITA